MANAQDTGGVDPRVAAANAAAAVAQAEKAAAEARKAQAEAELAAFKAQVGEVPASGYKGEVALRDKAGTMEAALLAARATEIAAKEIAGAVAGAVTAPKAEGGRASGILLFGAGEVPTFQALISFRAQTAIVKKALDDAIDSSRKADSAAPEPGVRVFVPPAAAVGLGLEAANKLLGYFRTDYSVGGVELTWDDSLLVQAVADRLHGKPLEVRLPAFYDPAALGDPSAAILARLTELSKAEAVAKGLAPHNEKLSKRFDDLAGKEADPKQKERLLENAALHRAAADALEGAATLADGLFAKLGTPDDKGAIPLVAATREAAIQDALSQGSYLLAVKLHRSGGANYTKSNMWTFFGGMPFFHMGGVVAGFVLVDGPTGRVLASGVVPIHGGFVKAGDVQGTVEEAGRKVKSGGGGGETAGRAAAGRPR